MAKKTATVTTKNTLAKKSARGKYPKKDIRYNTIAVLYEQGFINTFEDIFRHVPPSDVAQKLGMGLRYFKNKRIDTNTFQIKHVKALGKLFNIKPDDMFCLMTGIKKR